MPDAPYFAYSVANFDEQLYSFIHISRAPRCGALCLNDFFYIIVLLRFVVATQNYVVI